MAVDCLQSFGFDEYTTHHSQECVEVSRRWNRPIEYQESSIHWEIASIQMDEELLNEVMHPRWLVSEHRCIRLAEHRKDDAPYPSGDRQSSIESFSLAPSVAFQSPKYSGT